MELPKIIEESLEVEKESKTKTKKKVTFDDKVEEWNLHVFAKYFEYLYQQKFKKPYVLNKGDLKQLKRILKIKSKETIKDYMEIFMDLDFFETKTLRIFCSNYSQTVLDNYVTTGKLPSYKKEVKNEPENLDDWDKQIEELGW